MLQKLDSFATVLLQMPHSFRALPKPDATFATLKTLMADESFVGYPKQHNYQDYCGHVAPIAGGKMKKRLRTEKYFFLKYMQYGMGEDIQTCPNWYFDTITVQPPLHGHTGWHNSKNKGRLYLRFINNAGSGYSIEVKGKKQVTVRDQRRHIGAGNWTVLAGHMGKDGNTWFADVNSGKTPRVVIDVSIPEKYTNEHNAVINLLTNY